MNLCLRTFQMFLKIDLFLKTIQWFKKKLYGFELSVKNNFENHSNLKEIVWFSNSKSLLKFNQHVRNSQSHSRSPINEYQSTSNAVLRGVIKHSFFQLKKIKRNR
ncbi:hypothetical protein ACKWTF_011147 [Chironomus riparius]